MQKTLDEYRGWTQLKQAEEGGTVTCSKKQTLSLWRLLPVLPVLMLTRVPSAVAAVTQEANGAQSASAVQTSSDSVVPRLIQFSGTVKGADGKPAAGSVELTFSLYQFEEGGSPLWVETQTVPLDSQGRYTALLGAASPAGLPLDVFNTGAGRWLGVQPALPGVGEQPRVLLVGVPYAFKAADAETLGGKPASAYVTTETFNAPSSATPVSAALTSVGAQDRSPVAAGRKRSTSPLTACSSLTADGTATANFVSKFTSACVIHQSAIFESSGKVGIGNTSPGGALDVTGTTVLRGTLHLSQTTSSSVGVINMGGIPFVHACCSASADNTFIGINAGNFSTSGVGHNTASGFKALFANTTGAENTATGYFALSSNTTGASNTATGHEALEFNTSGFNNTATGFSALLSNGTGHDNTAMGDSALGSNTTGFQNVAVGESALFGGNTGFNNTAVGYAADSGDSAGSYNTSLGFQAGTLSNNLTNATAIGAFAGVGESSAIVLGCTLACPPGTTPPRVGIGTNTPGAVLDINAPNQVGLFVRGPENGVGAGLDFQTTGSGGLQWEILDTGTFAAQGPNKLNFRNVNTGNDIVTILANGQVGIETIIPDNTLTVNGSADKPGGGSWGTYSDGRLKTVAGTYDAGLDAILKLTPVRYRYKEQNAMGIKDDQEHIGFVAQEVEKVIQEAVSQNSRGYLLVNNDPILWTMLNAIKQQQAEIEALTSSAREKDAQIQKLTEKGQLLQKLQRQVGNLEGRLTGVEVKSENTLADVLARRRLNAMKHAVRHSS